MPDTVIDLDPANTGPAEWRPLLCRVSDPAMRRTVADLRARSGRVHDTLRDQLRELFEVRDPAATISERDLDQRIRAHLGDAAPDDYGTWVWYPWSRCLVHLLPEHEFTEVRLSRNRNKITAAEQAHLLALRIGIVGLSVGQATALTLAMEGIGGEFVLADFDTLSLSNLNRLRAAVRDLGVNKAVLTARQLAELNPYLRLRLYPDGLHEAQLDAFMTEGGRLDLVIEECDDMLMKWRVRETARTHRIPVLMETSDRGMLDVERFDREPDRPVFHGRAGDYDAERVRTLPPGRRVEVAMAILGADTLSPRLAASAVEIGASLRSWPQLASAVSLGAAVNTDTARRIALDEFQASGRYYVDLESIVHAEATPAPEPVALPVPPPAVSVAVGVLPDAVAEVRQLVAAAIAAPSGGNAQPWRFDWNGERLRCVLDTARAGKLLDYQSRASWLALGAAAENIVLAAGAQGRRASMVPFPIPADPHVAFDLRLEGVAAPDEVDPLHVEIPRRCTNRRLGAGAALPSGCADRLLRAASLRGATLTLFEDAATRAALGAILGRGDRLRFLSRSLHAELMGELRWSAEEAQRTGDGIDLRTLELGAMDLAALRLTASWHAMELVGRVGGGRNLERFAHQAAAGASALGILTIAGDTPAAFFQGGRATQRVWLTASALSLGFQPLAALPYLFMRAHEGGAGLAPGEVDQLLTLRAEARAIAPIPAGHSELLWFRIAMVDPPSTRALRRPVDDVLTGTT